MVAPYQGGSASSGGEQEWVLLAYRLPREPSTPRSLVWRKLKRLGVVQVADGVVALPADARTREALEWVAEDVLDHAGEATVWLGRPADAVGRAALVARMTAAVETEYAGVATEASEALTGDSATRGRTVARLRRELHRIEARDFFSAPNREQARRALDALATADQTVPL